MSRRWGPKVQCHASPADDSALVRSKNSAAASAASTTAVFVRAIVVVVVFVIVRVIVRVRVRGCPPCGD